MLLFASSSIARSSFRVSVLVLPILWLSSQTPAVAQEAVVPAAAEQIDGALLRPTEQDGQWGYTNATSRFVIAPQFESAEKFSEGVAAVELNKRFGYVDSDGCFVIRAKYFAAGPFKEGFAWVMTRKPWTPFGTGEYGFVARLGQGTFIDHSGRELRPPFSIASISNFSEGLAAVRPSSGKVGWILDVHGEWGIKPQFDEAHDFSDGLAAVNQGAKGHMGGKWGYIDKDGTLMIPFRYDFAGQFTKAVRASLKASSGS